MTSPLKQGPYPLIIALSLTQSQKTFVMDNPNLIQFIFLLFIASMSSCTSSFYVPNDNIMVQLKDKNEINISGSFLGTDTHFMNSENKISTRTAQLGYSPFKHVALAGSYFDVKQKFRGKGHIWNAALGTYYFFNFRDPHHKKPLGILVDIYAGGGEGNVAHKYENGGKFSADFQQYFIQGGLHFMAPYFDVGISLKRSLLNYHNGTTIYEIGKSNLNTIESLMNNNHYNPLDLNIRVSGGFKYGKGYININEVINPSKNLPLKLDTGTISVGVQLSVHEIVKGLKKNWIN